VQNNWYYLLGVYNFFKEFLGGIIRKFLLKKSLESVIKEIKNNLQTYKNILQGRGEMEIQRTAL
jgi:hypothetical protein